MKINLCFPTVVGISDCPFINEIQDEYKKIISNYKYEDHGFCYKEPHSNDKFKRLNDWINQELKKYIDGHLYQDEYECKESWLLDYKVGSNQPVHNHPGFVFSALFFLEGYEQDVSLTLLNPVDDMMNPLNNHAKTNPDTNNFTHRVISYPPKSGQLIIWRSYVMHSVDTKIKDCKRIVFAYNFDRKVK